MSWDDVEIDFGGDETANFGPRKESGSALYQVDTLATIGSRGDILNNPHLCASSSSQGFCVAADGQLSLFDDSCHQFHISLSFESTVDVVAWSDDDSFLIVAESSGIIHFVHTGIQRTLFSQTLVSKGELDSSPSFKCIIFSTVGHINTCELLVLACDGSLFRFSNINLTMLNDAIQQGNVTLAKQIQGNIQLEVIDTSPVHSEDTEYFCTATIGRKIHIVTCGSGDSIVGVWNKYDKTTILTKELGGAMFSGCSIRRCQVCPSSNYLLLLDNEASLSVWDLKSLLLLNVWSDVKVDEFILMSGTTMQSTSKSGQQVDTRLVLMSMPGFGGHRSLEVYILSSFKLIYKFQVGQHSILSDAHFNQEMIFVIEGANERFNDTITSLRIRCLTEALPEIRFQRLLHKHKFEEAEKFARLFQLDVEVKATTLLEKVAPWNVTPDEEDAQVIYDDLLTCFSMIPDEAFVVRQCIEATFPTFDTTYKLLDYARNRLNNIQGAIVSSEDDNASKPMLMTKLTEALHRLCTFKIAYGSESFSGHSWDKFRKADVFELIIKHLSKSEMSSAVKLWARHQSDFENTLEEDQLNVMMASIPENTPSSEAIPWLREDLIPFVLYKFPQGQKCIANWLEEKAINMEISEKTGWPANALEVADLFFSANQNGCFIDDGRGLYTAAQFSTQICNLSLGGFSKTMKNKEGENLTVEALTRLKELAKNLRELSRLHTKYRCKLTLRDYVKETTSSLAYRMLDRVKAANLVQHVLDTVVRQYMLENNLNEDKILLQYIEDLIERYGKQFTYTYEALWLEKAIAVVECINDVGNKCTAIFLLMNNVPFPWNDAMNKLVQAGLALQHPKVSQLKEKHRLMELKGMLIKYGLNKFDVNNSAQAQDVVKYILLKDSETAIEDALQVVKAYYHLKEDFVYMFRLRYLITKDRIEDVLPLLKSLEPDMSSHCCFRLLTWTLVRLDQPQEYLLDDEDKQEQVLVTEACIEVVKYLLTFDLELMEHDNLEEILKNLAKILALQVEYEEFMSLESYKNAQKRAALLTKYVVKFYMGNRKVGGIKKSIFSGEKEPSGDVLSFNKILKLSDLLQVPRSELKGQLAIKAAERGEIQSAIRLASEISEYCANVKIAESLYTICHILCKLLATKHQAIFGPGKTGVPENLPVEINRLANIALTYCNQDILQDCLVLCKHTSLAKQIYEQCEHGQYGVSTQKLSGSMKTDPYTHWSYDHYFKEDKLVLDADFALPLTNILTMTSLPKILPNLYTYQQSSFIYTAIREEDTQGFLKLSRASMNLVDNLKENNMFELAFHVLNETLMSAVMYVAVNTSGYAITDQAVLVCLENTKKAVMQLATMGLEMVSNTVSTLLEKMFGCRYVDLHLALGCLSVLPKQTALSKLKSLTTNAGQSYKKVMAIASVGCEYARRCDETNVLELCQELEINATWGYKLSKFKIPFKDAFMSRQTSDKLQILPLLIDNTGVDVKMIKEFCSAFSLEKDDALLMYLEAILLSPSTSSPKPFNEVLVINLTTEISNHSLLVARLFKILDKVDSYDYNRLMFVLRIILTLGADDGPEMNNAKLGLQLLDYLVMYPRCKPPGPYEVQYQCSTEEDKLVMTAESLSPLSSERLPYHPLVTGGQWKILSHELNEETVPKLIPIAKLLNLNMDELYVNALHNILKKQEVEGKNKAGKLDMKALEGVKSLLMSITNPALAVASARLVAQELPLGPEKVLALHFCVLLALRWKETCKDNNKELQKSTMMHKKLAEVHSCLATEQVLHKYSLADKQYLTMVHTPAKLIFKLYEHPSIEKRMAGELGVPDIHKAVDEIAKVNNSNINKIRQTLTEKWLLYTPTKQIEDETINFSFNTFNLIKEAQISEEEKSLRRVMYILQYSQIENSALYLLGYAFKESTTEVGFACQIRALRCLFNLINRDEIERVSLKHVDDIREYMQNLLYLNDLQSINAGLKMPSFISSNKDGLVRGLWRNHAHEPKALRLISDLCLDYEIYDPNLWNSILQQLYKFSMMDYLQHVLVTLSGIPCLWQVQCLPNIWKSIITRQFSTVSPPLTEDQELACHQAYVLLQRCPLLLDMDHLNFSRQFLAVEMTAHALGCLLLIPQMEKRKKQLQAMLSSKCHVTILDQVKLYQVNKKVLPQAQQIQAAVFINVDEEGTYDDLANTSHYQSLAVFLVNHQRMKNVTRYLLQQDRINDATQLVNNYLRRHPNTEVAKQTQNQSNLQKLKMFLESHNLEGYAAKLDELKK